MGRFNDLRKIPSEGSLTARLQMDRIIVAEQKTSEAVVFGFEQPAGTTWEMIDRQRLHWDEGDTGPQASFKNLLAVCQQRRDTCRPHVLFTPPSRGRLGASSSTRPPHDQ